MIDSLPVVFHSVVEFISSQGTIKSSEHELFIFFTHSWYACKWIFHFPASNQSVNYPKSLPSLRIEVVSSLSICC